LHFRRIATHFRTEPQTTLFGEGAAILRSQNPGPENSARSGPRLGRGDGTENFPAKENRHPAPFGPPKKIKTLFAADTPA